MSERGRRLNRLALLAGITLFAGLLLWLGISSASAEPRNASVRLFFIAGGFVLGAAIPRVGIAAVILAAPILPIVSRIWLGNPDISLAEHLFIGLLPPSLLRCTWHGEARPRTPIDAPLAGFVGFVLFSFALSLQPYATAGVGLRGLFGSAVQRHFAFGLGDVFTDQFLIVHSTLLWMESAAWFVLLTSPGLGLSARLLRRALLGGALLVGGIGAVQSVSEFAPIEFFVKAQPRLFRVSASLPDPNTLGAYLVLSLPLAVACSAQRHRGWTVVAGWVVLLGYCLLQSVSRSSWIGMVASGAAAVLLFVLRPQVLVLSPSAAARRQVARLSLAVASCAIAGVIAVTGFDGARSILVTEAASPRDVLLVTTNLRRPVNDLLPSRIEHWRAALEMWRTHPYLGVGIGRYPLKKLEPPGGIVDVGGGGDVKSIDVLEPLWVQGKGAADFERADVLAGDTIESASGGWGPIVIEQRGPGRRLSLASAVPLGSGLDYVIRHPIVDVVLRPHAHRSRHSRMPAFTDTHCYYLKVLAELGASGLAAFLLLLCGIGWALRVSWRRGDVGGRRRITGVGLGLLGFAVCSLAQDPLAVRDMQYVFWALVALPLLEAAAAPRTP